MLRSLDHRVAWVTGAGSGIGEAAARMLANAGMTVLLSGRREHELERVAGEIENDGGAAHAVPLNVADATAVDAAIAHIKSRFGRVDVLVHSAGMNIKDRHWRDGSVASFDQLIRVNVNGAFYCCRAVLPIMRDQQDGLIVAISSWAGRHPSMVAGAAYSASKHALNVLTDTINMEECIHGIRACAVCPGEVSTAILDERPTPPSPEDRERMLQPEDMAEIILFLARLPERVCINDLLVSPTWNRAYLAFHPNR